MIRHGVQLQNVFYSAEIWLSAVWYSWSLTPSCILQHGLWFQAIFYRVDSDSKLYFTMQILTPNRIYVQHMDSDSISYFTMQILTPNRIYVQHGFWLPAVFYNADSDYCTFVQAVFTVWKSDCKLFDTVRILTASWMAESNSKLYFSACILTASWMAKSNSRLYFTARILTASWMAESNSKLYFTARILTASWMVKSNSKLYFTVQKSDCQLYLWYSAESDSI